MNGLRTERGSRVVAASGIAAIVLAFVYATQPAIAKAPLCETAAWGLLILLAFAGWGGVLDRLLFRDRSADFGLRAVWGASVVLFVGGILAAASLFSRTADVLLVDVGLVGFAALLYVERRRNAESVLLAWRVVRRNGLLSLMVAVVLLAAVADWSHPLLHREILLTHAPNTCVAERTLLGAIDEIVVVLPSQRNVSAR